MMNILLLVLFSAYADTPPTPINSYEKVMYFNEDTLGFDQEFLDLFAADDKIYHQFMKSSAGLYKLKEVVSQKDRLILERGSRCGQVMYLQAEIIRPTTSPIRGVSTSQDFNLTARYMLRGAYLIYAPHVVLSKSSDEFPFLIDKSETQEHLHASVRIIQGKEAYVTHFLRVNSRELLFDTRVYKIRSPKPFSIDYYQNNKIVDLLKKATLVHGKRCIYETVDSESDTISILRDWVLPSDFVISGSFIDKAYNSSLLKKLALPQ